MSRRGSVLGWVAVLLACLALALPARGQGDSLEQRLSSTDPGVSRAAAEEVLKSADRAEPLILMQASSRLFVLGDKDKGVFWFYAGQLRARYSPQLTGENSQLITIFVMTLGEEINAYAMRDVATMITTINKALAWDAQTFDAWARANKIDPLDPELGQRRTRARDGLVAFTATLKSKQQEYEKQAREYKSFAQRQQEEQTQAAESVKQNYTTALLERMVGGQTLRIPANYLTPNGRAVPAQEATRELTVIVFLPTFGGYTRDNWSTVSGNKNVMWVRVNGDSSRKPEELIEAFIATGPPITQAFGFDAYYFDSRKTKARLPLHGYSVEYVLAGKRGTGDATYMVCQAPEPGITRPAPRCELFIFDPPSGLRIRATFSQDHAPQWLKMVTQLSKMLDSWLVTY
jgi:hypothetical protein